MRRANLKQQNGFTLIEASIAIAISMIAIVAIGKALKLVIEHYAAASQGAMIAQYNSAVASYVTAEPARLANLNPPQVFAAFGNYQGIGWLQAPPCAGATGAVAYLPCGWDDTSTFGLTLNTTVAPNGQFILATTNLGPAITGIGVDRPQGAAIVRAAESYMGSYSANIQRTNGFTKYTIDPPTGNLAAIVDTAVLGEPYLRTDGSNQMLNRLNMGGNSIGNANNVNASGTVAAQTVQAAGNVNAGQNVTANTAGGGGNVKIAGSDVTLAESVQAPVYVTNGGFVDKPQCPPDKPVPRVFGQLGQFQSGDKQDPVTSVQLNYSDNGARWQIFVIAYTVNHPGGIPGNAYTTVLVATTCGN